MLSICVRSIYVRHVARRESGGGGRAPSELMQTDTKKPIINVKLRLLNLLCWQFTNKKQKLVVAT